ncbi:TRAP-type mannitol/chloroaromatic compound transport system, small permease component [Rhizobium lusitanum]|uniref:TRAP transporter small permease protein n=2 Tax=Rhizobium lusitanum TaxID=293958 RepID=A0A1C3TWX8_9HYPH|nr:TRAP-type mannitol/chloroaromatic compound transport system, small permease component [Rhizobium lusitanum]
MRALGFTRGHCTGAIITLGKPARALDSPLEIGTLPVRGKRSWERPPRGEIMKTLLGFSRIVDYATEIIGKSVSWLILVAVLVSAGNAIVRKTFNISSNAWLEAQWYLFGAAFMLAAAYTLRQNEHIRIDIVYGSLPRRAQHWIDLIGHCLFLMPFALLMVYDLVPYVRMSVMSGEVSSSAGGLIIWPGKALLLAGFFLLALQGISEIIKKIAVMRGDMEDPNPYVPTHAPLEVETPVGETRR